MHQYAWKLPCNIKILYLLLINIVVGTSKAACFGDEIGYQSKFCCCTEINVFLLLCFLVFHCENPTDFPCSPRTVLRSHLCGEVIWQSVYGTAISSIRPLPKPQCVPCPAVSFPFHRAALGLEDGLNGNWLLNEEKVILLMVSIKCWVVGRAAVDAEARR